jgi:ribonuclease VapC
MYFNSQTLIDMLSDEAVAAKAAPAIEADRKRMTSPLAVVEAVLALAAPDTPGKSLQETEARVLAYLDEKDIELRETPPANKTIGHALAAAMAGPGDVVTVLHKAFADYYEVPAFSLADVPAPEPEA